MPSTPNSASDPAPDNAGVSDTVLSVRGLTTAFNRRGHFHAAVRHVGFDLQRNETLCLVGESGCGKSVTALSLMRLLPGRRQCRVSGSAWFDGQDLLALSEPAMTRLRGARLSMIFQEPMTSLNPVLPIGAQVGEPLVFHRGLSRQEAEREALRLLDLVKIPDAARRLRQFPHQFSGGMRQRVMIAMALACRPDILFADEPTTALDVTIQAQVLALLNDLRQERNLSLVLITHDLGVVASVADRVAVMYAGEIVEQAPADRLFARPSHPYTEALLRSIPRSDRDVGELRAISGQVPPIHRMPAGCRYAPRCPVAEAACLDATPALAPLPGDPAHAVRCRVRNPAAASEGRIGHA